MEDEYPYLVVSLLSDDATKIGFNTPTQSISFTVISKYNLIDILFNGLEILFKQSPFKITVSNLLGSLLSSENNRLQFCCTLLPPHFLQPLCVNSQHLSNLRMFLYLCTCMCEGVECFELDSAGNHTPLQPFQTHSETENDQQLVKDVTDAFQSKLLELRSKQEGHEDPTEIVESVQLIWKNVCLLWNLDDCPGIEKLSRRWNEIVSWERSTRKKQVRNDAKLVLATRLCLEQGKIRKNSSSTNQKLSPQECMELLEPLQLWSILILSEYFHCLLVTHSIACYIHLLLCPTECEFEFNSKQRSADLPEQLVITSLIRNKKDSSGLAKRLISHCHKYQISRKIPKQYVPESESESESESSLLREDQNEDEEDGDDQDLDHLLKDQLRLRPSSSRIQTMPHFESQYESSHISNSSLSISGVRSPPHPLPSDDHPYRSKEFLPSQSDYEPTTRSMRTVNRTPDQTTNNSLTNETRRSNNLSSAKIKKKSSNLSPDSPADQPPKASPQVGLVTPRASNTKRLSPGSDGPTLLSESAYQTPIAAFGRSTRSSQSKISTSRSSSPDDYLLTSSSLRSLDKQSLGSSFDSGSARKRSQDRIREKKRLEYEAKLRLEQEAVLRKDKLKSLEMKAEIARLSHQPMNPHLVPTAAVRSQSAPSTPTHPPDRRHRTSKMTRTSVKEDHRATASVAVRGDTSISPQEARTRALIRLKEHREKVSQEKEYQQRLRQQQARQKWDERDKKIREFIARQENGSSPIYSPSSSTSSPSKLIINWDAVDDSYRDSPSSTQRVTQTPTQQQRNTQQQGHRPGQGQGQETQRNHLEDTLDEIHELSALIDHTLGIHATPSPTHRRSSSRPTHPPPASAAAAAAAAVIPSRPAPPIYSPTKLTDMLCIKVLQVHSLAPNLPKNLNLYVSFDWESLGKASTHALPQTVAAAVTAQPHISFNATLRFRSPLPHGSSLQDALMTSPPLLVELHGRAAAAAATGGNSGDNRQKDLCLGRHLIEDVSLFDFRRQPIQVKLLEGQRGSGRRTCAVTMAGVVDIEIVIM